MSSIGSVSWPAAVRDLQVRAGTQNNCEGFAWAMADFEPQPDPTAGLTFVIALERRPHDCQDDELEPWCCDNVERGVRAELARHFGDLLPAVRVTLRRILVNPVDSNAARNEEAGRRLVVRALSVLPGV